MVFNWFQLMHDNMLLHQLDSVMLIMCNMYNSYLQSYYLYQTRLVNIWFLVICIQCDALSNRTLQISNEWSWPLYVHVLMQIETNVCVYYGWSNVRLKIIHKQLYTTIHKQLYTSIHKSFFLYAKFWKFSNLQVIRDEKNRIMHW